MSSGNSDESFSKTFDLNMFDILDQISPYIDTYDSLEVDMFSDLHIHPSSSDSIYKLIMLFLMILKNPDNHIVKDDNSNFLIKKLLIHLSNCSNAIQYMMCQVDNNSDSEKIPINKKVVLQKQADNIKNFLESMHIEEVSDHLTNYTLTLQEISDLPNKIVELDILKKRADNENNLEVLKSFFDNIYSILEMTLTFNDYLLVNKFKTKSNNQDHNINEMKEDLKNTKSIINHFEEIVEEKNEIAYKLNNAREKIENDLQTIALINKLKSKLKKVEEENKSMHEAISRLEQYNKNFDEKIENESEELQNQLRSYKKENSFLKDQIEEYHDQVENWKKQATKKTEKIEHLINKVKTLKTQNDDFSKKQSKLQLMLKDFQSLYQESILHLEEVEKSKNEISKTLSEIRKENNILNNENDELKEMLKRASKEAQKQILDNSTLLKQLKRYKDMKDSSGEIDRLKEKLHAAQIFIKKLQGELSTYKESLQNESSPKIAKNKYNFSANLSSDDNESMDETDLNSQNHNNFDSIDPKLDDLDKTISLLEETMHRSRVSGLYPNNENGIK